MSAKIPATGAALAAMGLSHFAKPQVFEKITHRHSRRTPVGTSTSTAPSETALGVGMVVPQTEVRARRRDRLRLPDSGQCGVAGAECERPVTTAATPPGTGDAVVIGRLDDRRRVFVVFRAGRRRSRFTDLLIGLAVAAVVAYRNATTSARLAAMYPMSGGTYVYFGPRTPGEFWGYLAGWSRGRQDRIVCGHGPTVGLYLQPARAPRSRLPRWCSGRR